MDFSIRRDMEAGLNFSSRSYPTKSSEREASSKVGGSYDKLSISGSSRLSDKDFATMLAKEITGSIKETASQKRVAELHSRVQSGEYHISSIRIAEKMLGYRD